MRIVAGKYRSRVIKAVEGLETRPTADRVKEAVFSSLGTYFQGGMMLDLFAGSGNVGLEAISRGIEKVVFVDISNDAIKTINGNVATLKVASQCEVWKMDYMTALDKCCNAQYKFDLIYLDAPYDFKNLPEILLKIMKNEILAANGIIVVENRKKDDYLIEYDNIEMYKEANYGIAKIRYFRRKDV